VRNDVQSFLQFMLPALILTIIALGLTVSFKPRALPVMGTLFVIWIVSPLIAYWVSKPRTAERKVLNAEDRAFARLIARRTWRFFETFVGADDNWLPPDPSSPIARPQRTSDCCSSAIALRAISATSARSNWSSVRN
jgi:hypothetical protein